MPTTNALFEIKTNTATLTIQQGKRDIKHVYWHVATISSGSRTNKPLHLILEDVRQELIGNIKKLDTTNNPSKKGLQFLVDEIQKTIDLSESMIQTLLNHGYTYAQMPKVFRLAAEKLNDLYLRDLEVDFEVVSEKI